MSRHTRRRFVHHAGFAAFGLSMADRVRAIEPSAASAATTHPEWLPRQDPSLVQAMVGAAHSDIKRVSELLEQHPSLANASVDWGFGDWEDALGAASHTGRREIAEVLLAHGARMSIFAAAMLGQLDVVKAFVAARPGVQRTLGPHSITLLSHAKAGGPGSTDVVKYLEALGDADRYPATASLEPGDRNAIVGRYVFGTGPRDYFDVDVNDRNLAGITRPGAPRHIIAHTGSLVFFPTGVPSLKIAFARTGATVTQLTLAEAGVYLTARRE
jgi:hypothetical protein